ncbi:hypothetical protein T459_23383 [Capsicum annuum]|uniref:Uncharacterized protein n=1 Tax=Capsicum annuum TaxID=4072 RepID=A0A2G2YS69_CAPAN|nr:hypothetical protein T459_23383 [Capsicum annuum]
MLMFFNVIQQTSKAAYFWIILQKQLFFRIQIINRLLEFSRNLLHREIGKSQFVLKVSSSITNFVRILHVNEARKPYKGPSLTDFSFLLRLLIAYESGLIILWDVVEAHVIIVKGDKDLHLKDVAVNFKKNTDSSSPDDLLQHQLEDKEITTLCWASTDGSILAAGYIDGDILLWKTSKSTASKGQEAGPFDNVVKLQLSSSEKRLPIIVLHWWANSKSRNNSDGHLLIYGGDETGSDEVITVSFTLKSQK